MLARIKTVLTYLGALASTILAVILGMFLLKRNRTEKKLEAIDERAWQAAKLAELEYKDDLRRIHDHMRVVRAQRKKQADDIADSGSFTEHIKRDLSKR